MAASTSLGFDAQHRQRLRAQAVEAGLGVVGFVLVLAGAGVALFARLRDPAFASRGQLLLLLPLAAFWLWRLAPAFGRLRQVGRDLRAGRLAWVEGIVRCDFHLGFGLIRTVTYTARVDAWQGALSAADFQQLQPGAAYRIYFAPHSQSFLGAVALGSTAPWPPTQAPPQAPDGLPAPLSPSPLSLRELELLQLVAAGHSNKEIAARLALSPNTVKMYNSVIYEKLGVRRRTEAVARARALGLL